MDYEAEFIGNNDMFTAYFGQDDYLSPCHGEQKSHDNIDNVWVEKLSDYGVTTGAEIDTNFEDADSLFDNEWMTARIDLSSCFTEQFDSNFNLVSVHPEEIQSTSVSTDLLDNNSSAVKKLDVTNTTSGCIDEAILDDSVPISPEQHVPDLDGVGDFTALLDSYLAAARNSVQDSFSDDVESPPVANLPIKRKMVESTGPAPKAKVRTPEQKQRKKLQNRNAATRYRSKKRTEQEALNAQCEELECENAELRKKVEDKRQEVQYLKSLIIDVFNKRPARV